MALHDRVRAEALAVRHDANGTTLHADHAESFASAARDELRRRRAELDPLHDRGLVSDAEAYAAVAALPAERLDALVDLLTVECVTAHLQRRTDLVCRLAEELGVDVRRHWRPDAAWLAGYQKAQLVHLTYQLRGPAYGGAAERKKKSELVAELAQLFRRRRRRHAGRRPAGGPPELVAAGQPAAPTVGRGTGRSVRRRVTGRT